MKENDNLFGYLNVAKPEPHSTAKPPIYIDEFDTINLHYDETLSMDDQGRLTVVGGGGGGGDGYEVLFKTNGIRLLSPPASSILIGKVPAEEYMKLPPHYAPMFDLQYTKNLIHDGLEFFKIETDVVFGYKDTSPTRNYPHYPGQWSIGNYRKEPTYGELEYPRLNIWFNYIDSNTGSPAGNHIYPDYADVYITVKYKKGSELEHEFLEQEGLLDGEYFKKKFSNVYIPNKPELTIPKGTSMNDLTSLLNQSIDTIFLNAPPMDNEAINPTEWKERLIERGVNQYYNPDKVGIQPIQIYIEGTIYGDENYYIDYYRDKRSIGDYIFIKVVE